LKRHYHENFGVLAEIYVCEAVDGAMVRNAPNGNVPKQEPQF